ncbi:hypothetical protein G5B37_04435 [Rasiella rasia]|uniref:SGNH/GDSL hydrolase family protein n=1 Tax=Rasiella rasia TaxID=2744027 RepID=A0A6G6GK94_9FLAO|nr:DUF4886 domain-containing protein [Rasiella rasia]QIE58833.1 hypothetical protein G5B37_04435 [Rasiella rasia]
MKYWSLFVITLIIAGCSDTSEAPAMMQQDDDPIDDPNIVNILFIGNSLTFFNNGVDFHVQQFYDNGAQGGDQVLTDERTLPGYTLHQHLNNAGTTNKLESKTWDVVVLQENGDHARTNPEDALASFNAYKEYFEGKSTQVYLFMTWEYTGFPKMTEQLETLYYQAATETGFTVLPVGLGWRDVNATKPEYELLSPDGVHPSLYGTYFSAAMIFEILSGQQVTTNSYAPQLPVAHSMQLKQYAHDAVVNYFN